MRNGFIVLAYAGQAVIAKAGYIFCMLDGRAFDQVDTTVGIKPFAVIVIEP